MTGRDGLAETYCVSGPRSLGARLIARARRGLYGMFARRVQVEEMESVLDVGVTADRACAYSNYFERTFPHPERIVAFSDQDAVWMEEAWPGLRFVRGDACRLPFPDGTFDLVFSSAVLEHVGSRERQARFLSECVRVARKCVFLTTPDRAFPLEMHSGIPFLHWLPMPLFRRLLRLFGQAALASEANLNLLTARELEGLCRRTSAEDCRLYRYRFCGFPSNLVLVIRKGS